jgi:uncharacterized protein with HEPN domain
MTKTAALRVRDYLAHIVEAIDRIDRYVHDMTELTFLSDEKTQDAVVRNLEILGEAANNIDKQHPTYAQAHKDVPWALMYTMRNRVAHGYFKVDYELVWKTIHADLPELRAHVLGLVSDRSRQSRNVN